VFSLEPGSASVLHAVALQLLHRHDSFKKSRVDPYEPEKRL
jgi:hypothetical protein